MERCVDEVDSVLSGVEADARDGGHHDCHANGNGSEDHDDRVGPVL